MKIISFYIIILWNAHACTINSTTSNLYTIYSVYTIDTELRGFRGRLFLQGGAVLDHTTIDCRGGVLGGGEALSVHQTFVFSVWHVSRIALDIADVLGR